MRLLPGAFREYYDGLTDRRAKVRFQFILQKRFFDTGHGITDYFKIFILGFAIATGNVKETIWITVLYAILCYFVGWGWFYFDFSEVETEISNLVNVFVRQMRELKNDLKKGRVGYYNLKVHKWKKHD